MLLSWAQFRHKTRGVLSVLAQLFQDTSTARSLSARAHRSISYQAQILEVAPVSLVQPRNVACSYTAEYALHASAVRPGCESETVTERSTACLADEEGLVIRASVVNEFDVLRLSATVRAGQTALAAHPDQIAAGAGQQNNLEHNQERFHILRPFIQFTKACIFVSSYECIRQEPSGLTSTPLPVRES
jgi:hypothetical protein